MFKALKYIFLANLYKRAKTSIIIFFSSFVAMVVFSFIINDIISVSHGVSLYVLLGVKWLVLLALLGLMVYSFLKVLNLASSPFENEKKDSVVIPHAKVDDKKEYILAKDKLYTKSEQILQKYMEV